MLANVTLAITGAEALYADLSHFSRPAIARAWNFMVAPCLMINYLGQAAHAIDNPADVGNLFFSLAPKGGQFALTLLSIAATVIASQALITGAYSLTQQASNLGYFPRTRVLHTNAEHEGQIYLPGINMILAVGAIIPVLYFQKSNNLANAYGLAVTGTMITTTIAYTAITYAQTGRFPVDRAAAHRALTSRSSCPTSSSSLHGRLYSRVHRLCLCARHHLVVLYAQRNPHLPRGSRHAAG